MLSPAFSGNLVFFLLPWSDQLTAYQAGKCIVYVCCDGWAGIPAFWSFFSNLHNQQPMKTMHILKILPFLAVTLVIHAGETAKAVDNAIPKSVPKDQVIVKVDGVVCAFCANGLRKGLCRFDFVDTGKKGKGISLDAKKQLLTIQLKKDGKPDLKKVFESIRKGGYKPVEAYSSVDGKIVQVHKAEK